MKRFLSVFGFAPFLVLGVTIILGMTAVGTINAAMAATRGDTPKAKYGAVAVATASATKVFTGMNGRNAFAIFNNGPNTIWCGYDTAVTTSTGMPVVAGGFLAIDLVFNASGDQDVYCIATSALQVTPSDTRWMQVK